MLHLYSFGSTDAWIMLQDEDELYHGSLEEGKMGAHDSSKVQHDVEHKEMSA